MRRQLIDLNLAELADISDAFALQGAEVGRDAAVFEVHDSCKRFVEKGADRGNREVSSFSLFEAVSFLTSNVF